MRLSELAKAAKTVAHQPNHSILIYGPPKSGKTQLIGTAAKIPEIRYIHWFDTENGVETLINMGLTAEEMDKIFIYKLPDTRENPIAIETMLRAFSTKVSIRICEEHGVVNCVHCKKDGQFTGNEFRLADCGHNDLIVIDSGSQLGDSALNGACKGKDVAFKPTFDEYMMAGKWLGDLLSVIQQAHHTNFVMATHEIALEGDDGKDRMFPLMGTKNFSMKCAKYFGTVVYCHMKLGKNAAPDMRTILIEGGVLKPGVEVSIKEEQSSSSAIAANAVKKLFPNKA